MFLTDWLTKVLGGHHVDVAAAELAIRTRDRVWDQVSHQVFAMGEAEALGYTRAKSQSILAAEAKHVVAAHPNLGGWATKKVVEEASLIVAREIWQLTRKARSVERHRRQAA